METTELQSPLLQTRFGNPKHKQRDLIRWYISYIWHRECTVTGLEYIVHGIWYRTDKDPSIHGLWYLPQMGALEPECRIRLLWAPRLGHQAPTFFFCFFFGGVCGWWSPCYESVTFGFWRGLFYGLLLCIWYTLGI